MAAAVTFVFTIPANSDHWRMEIWKRGGGSLDLRQEWPSQLDLDR